MIKSKGEEIINSFLEEVIPAIKVERQYYVYYKGKKLLFDFYIPSWSIMIEVQGEQHNKFIEFFHGNRDGFIQQKVRDFMKQEWAAGQGVKILEINKKNFPENSSRLLEIILEEVESEY